METLLICHEIGHKIAAQSQVLLPSPVLQVLIFHKTMVLCAVQTLTCGQLATRLYAVRIRLNSTAMGGAMLAVVTGLLTAPLTLDAHAVAELYAVTWERIKSIQPLA